MGAFSVLLTFYCHPMYVACNLLETNIDHLDRLLHAPYDNTIQVYGFMV
jgi:hypothetical protein